MCNDNEESFLYIVMKASPKLQIAAPLTFQPKVLTAPNSYRPFSFFILSVLFLYIFQSSFFPCFTQPVFSSFFSPNFRLSPFLYVVLYILYIFLHFLSFFLFSFFASIFIFLSVFYLFHCYYFYVSIISFSLCAVSVTH